MMSCHQLAILPYEMPSHDTSSNERYQRLAQNEDGFETIDVDDDSIPPIKEDPEFQERGTIPSLAVIITFVASFYFCSCGIERLFQSMVR